MPQGLQCPVRGRLAVYGEMGRGFQVERGEYMAASFDLCPPCQVEQPTSGSVMTFVYRWHCCLLAEKEKDRVERSGLKGIKKMLYLLPKMRVKIWLREIKGENNGWKCSCLLTSPSWGFLSLSLDVDSLSQGKSQFDANPLMIMFILDAKFLQFQVIIIHTEEIGVWFLWWSLLWFSSALGKVERADVQHCYVWLQASLTLKALTLESGRESEQASSSTSALIVNASALCQNPEEVLDWKFS